LEAYCVKCRVKREIQDPVAGFNKNGTPVTRGTCPVCGTRMNRMGRTEEHTGLTPPQSQKETTKKKSGKLVIVESPAKAKTIGRYLGKDYTVRASVGHVRDLLKSQLSVDVNNNFEPKYRIPNEKRPIVKEIKKIARDAQEIFLATDPDREGEAIAWHLVESAEIDPERSKRVEFYEITQEAIREAFQNPRSINMDLVNAQQARRIVDRLVGYNLSPLLWEKVRSRLSAGRVQSVALRLIVEREREIDNFNPVEYWSIEAEFKPENEDMLYIAKLVRVDDHDPALGSEAIVEPILTDMRLADYRIHKIKRGQRKRSPSAPFITSSLQQEASRKFGFTARKTMTVAQQLYEGLDIGEGGSTGLITYMRTDSTNVAAQAINEVRNYIRRRYGDSYVPGEAQKYRTRAKSAQEAHEAIRPTSVNRQPEQIKGSLSRDQYRLYQLIWQRFVASQMEAALYDTITVEIQGISKGHNYQLRASGSVLKFAGFLVVYEESLDEDRLGDEAENVRIPLSLTEGEKQKLIRLIPEQHFTQPPPRFTEASLVQLLEEYGIGRPSTYAAILSTIQDRGYVFRESKRLIPTDTGFLVNDLLVDHFSEIVDTGFTASLEEGLDDIAAGERNWQDVIGKFYAYFLPRLQQAQVDMPVMKAEPEKVGRNCPECGHELIIRWGRFGKFISCSNFPACRYIEPLLDKIGVTCPLDGGAVVRRKSRKGRVFYGCENYPACKFTSWSMPLPEPCPNCGGLLVTLNKKEAKCTQCDHKFSLEKIQEMEPASGA
jgi:DNA topoisomerase I